jgi:hypothetical protein
MDFGMSQHERTRTILLALACLILCTTGCALIQKSHYWQPETANTETIKKPSSDFTFQHGNVYLDVHSPGGWNVTYFFGPPFIPIIPRFLFPPYRKVLYAMILFEIRSPDDTTIIDFPKIRLQYSGEKTLQLRRIKDISEKPTIEIPIEKTVISKKKASYILIPELIPYGAEELLLDFGSLEINGNDVKLPVFKWRIVTEYRYEPLYFD